MPYRMRNRHIYNFTTYLLHRYCLDRFLTMGLKTHLNRLARSALFIRFNPVFSTLHIETTHYCMWLHPVSVKKNVQTYISPKLCLTPEIKSKYFRTGECVGIGQTTVLASIRNAIRSDIIMNAHYKKKSSLNSFPPVPDSFAQVRNKEKHALFHMQLFINSIFKILTRVSVNLKTDKRIKKGKCKPAYKLRKVSALTRFQFCSA